MASHKCLFLLLERLSKILHCISTFLGLKYNLTVNETGKAPAFIKDGGKLERRKRGKKGGRGERKGGDRGD